MRSGEAREVRFDFHADLTSFTGVNGHRIVEPGDLELRLSTSSAATCGVVHLRLIGDERVVGHDRRMVVPASVLTPSASDR